MTDADFARAFERGEIENGAFGHPSHLRVAWVYLHECGSIDEATDRMAATLRQFAASAGKADKYHQTLTVFWVQAVALAGGTMDAATAAEVMRAHPWLLDKDLPLAFYSRDRLFSDAARRAQIAPDRQPLTIHAAACRATDSPGDAPDRPLPGRSA